MADGALTRDGQGFAEGATRHATMAWLLSTTMLAAFISGVDSNPALAKPRGGSVAAGQATIIDGGDTTTIQQGSAKAIINWQDFSIGKGEAVRFQQPSRNAIALNRVTGKEPSNLLGTLTANGNVWLVNPNGVFIGPSATISAGGFMATTSDILDTDFMKGNYAFTRPSPVAGASVVNEGLISVAEAGLAALVAPHVRNDGMIIGRLGTVILAGTPTFTLDLQGDGLLQFAIGEGAAERMAGDPGRVEMGGRIGNDGGDILLTAAAAAGIVDDVINVGGVIEARTVAERNGEIILAGGDGGTVRVGGRLDATATDTAARGGVIDVLGDRVIIDNGAIIDASGGAGGGTLRIGGDARGRGDVRTASLTGVAESATLRSDAIASGDGGHIVVWAQDYADVRGHLTARGGAGGGNGGFIETSSAGGMWLTPQVDTQAPRGTAGSWLIDPTDVQIVASSGNPGSERVPPVFAADPDPAGGGPVYVLTSVLAGATSPVIVEATRNVDVLSPVSMGTDLSLHAGNTLTIAQPVVTTGNVSLAGTMVREEGQGRISSQHLDLRAATADSVADLGGDNTVSTVSAGPTSGGIGSFSTFKMFNAGNLMVGGTGIAADSVFVTANQGALTIASPIAAKATVEVASIVRTEGDPGPPLLSRVGGALNLAAPITVSGAGGSVLLGGAFIQQNGGASITASGLGAVAMASGGGGVPVVSLQGPNAVDKFTFKPIDVATAPISSVSFRNQKALAFVNGPIGSVDFSDRPARAGAIRFDVGGGLTIAKSLIGTGTGTSILVNAQTLDNSQLGTNGIIANPSGAGGRFLVYTQDPRLDQRNYDGGFGKRYGFPFDGTNGATGIPAGKSLPADGNFFLYEVLPILTLTIDNATRSVGQANPPLTRQSPVGLIDDDSLDDALAGGEAGLQLVTTANLLSPAGVYPITFAPPPVPSALGYDLVVSNGTLTVTGEPPPPPPAPPPPLDDLRNAVIPVESQVTQPEDILQDRAATQQADLAHGQPQVLGESPSETRRVSPIPKQRAERLGDPLFANGGNRSLWSP